MTLSEVLAVAKLGAEQGCTEALFTLGESDMATSLAESETATTDKSDTATIWVSQTQQQQFASGCLSCGVELFTFLPAYGVHNVACLIVCGRHS